VTGRWFSPSTLVSQNNTIERHDIAEILLKENFEGTKGVIRIRKAKKDRKRNGQKKKGQTTNNDL
jgi:hypothetical protein